MVQHILQTETKVATIPVGYADEKYVKCRQGYYKRCIPIIGRICMDYFMVDVTDIEGVSQGDVVTLLGKREIV